MKPAKPKNDKRKESKKALPNTSIPSNFNINSLKTHWHYLLAILQALWFSYYLYISHENELWFSNISNLEREISFRTEQGLYYNNFKILVDPENSFITNFKKILNDKKTEYPNEINLLKRFNIFPEVLLADVWRYLAKPVGEFIFKYRLETILDARIVQYFNESIIFYTYSIFLLQALQSFSVFLITDHLTGNTRDTHKKESYKLASLLAQFSLFANLFDITRVHSTVPLRESFALPVLFLQIYYLNLFLTTKSPKQRVTQKITSKLYFSTLLFCLCWQFNQFVLLLEILPIIGLYLINKIDEKMIDSVSQIYLFSLVTVFLLQFMNPMIPRSIVWSLCFSLVVYVRVVNIGRIRTQIFNLKLNLKADTLLKKLFKILINLLILVALTLTLNIFIFKKLFIFEADSHIYKFLISKMTSPKYCSDFDANLYVCNGAFQFLTAKVYKRLITKGGFGLFYLLFSVYLVMKLVRFVFFGKFDEKSGTGKPVHDSESSSNEPVSVIYNTILSILFLIMAAIVRRMKFLFTPFIGILGSYFISTCYKRSRALYYLLILSSFCHVFYENFNDWHYNLTEFGEFQDKDTVEFLDWINDDKNTDESKSVFSGTMQVMSMIKLSTNRAITNHPHYEDKTLRETTFDIYQMYGRIYVNDYYKLLKKHGTTHIVVENSICFQNDGPDGNVDYCDTKSILDRSNNHTSTNRDEEMNVLEQKEIDSKNRAERFCLAVMHQGYVSDEGPKFKKVFQNRTFRIYELA